MSAGGKSKFTGEVKRTQVAACISSELGAGRRLTQSDLVAARRRRKVGWSKLGRIDHFLG